MPDSYVQSQLATASRTARYLRQCRTMRHCRLRSSNSDVAKGPGPLGAPLDEGGSEQQAIQPPQRKLFSWGTATVCTSPCKSVFRRGLKEINFHFAHESSNPICPAMQSVSAMCRDAMRNRAIAARYR